MPKKLNIFILEDEIDKKPRNAILDALEGHNLTIARSRDEAQTLFSKNMPYDVVILDHDMRGFFDPPTYKNTGTQFLVWLWASVGLGDMVDKPWILHSQNSEGRAAMRQRLQQYGFPDIREFSFGPTYVEYLRKEFGLKK